MNVSVTPIFPTRERNREEGAIQGRKRVDSKVRGFVLERISQTKGGLPLSPASSQVVIDFLPVFEVGRNERAPKKNGKKKMQSAKQNRRAPIGLRPVDPEGWLNALMQFIIFIPELVELFFFAPRSFHPFREFIDQYVHDREENCATSGANGILIFRFLRAKLDPICLSEVFQFFIQTLHPKWKIHRTIEDALKEGIPTNFFVTEAFSRKQVFLDSHFLCYDLDAFIELRSDGSLVNFVTYVKCEGVWYQCDDERISQLRSNRLSIPLSRAILLHYRRIDR